MNKESLFKITYGLYIITTKFNDIDNGCIVNSFFQITENPIQVCLVLNKKNYTTELINKSKILNCGILKENTDMNIIKHFGYQSGRNVDKFKEVSYFKDTNNVKQIKDVVAFFSCRVTKTLDVGSHILFICDVIEGDILKDESVLTYASYHKRKSRKGYRCTICGFIYEGELLPLDYICPICKVDASYFEKIE